MSNESEQKNYNTVFSYATGGLCLFLLAMVQFMADSHIEGVGGQGQVTAVQAGPNLARQFPKAKTDFHKFEALVKSNPAANPYHIVEGHPVKTKSSQITIRCPAAKKGSNNCPDCMVDIPSPLQCAKPVSVHGASWKTCSQFVSGGGGGPGWEHINLVNEILSDAPKGATVLDVGSNEGVITMFLGAKGFNTIGFEAIPGNYHKVQSAIVSSGLAESTKLVLGAVSDTCGDVVRISENMSGGQANGQVLDGDTGSKHMGRQLAGNVFEIPTVRIDSLVNAEVHFAKIDVEGSEPRAVAGMAALFTNRLVNWVHMEYSPSNMKTVSKDDGTQMLLALEELGYDVYLEDCMHNIDAATKRAINCQNAIPGMDLVKAIRSGNTAVSDKLKWSRRQIVEYTKTMLHNSLDVSCCLVNLLIHRRSL